MGKVIRYEEKYDPNHSQECICHRSPMCRGLEESPEGSYVDYEEYEKLKQRIAELESQHQLLTKRIEPLLDMQEEGELYARCHLADDIYESFVEGSSVDALNKFAIEQQIEALAHVLSSYKTQKFCPTNYAIQAFNDGVAHLWAHIVNCELQLRKGGELWAQ